MLKVMSKREITQMDKEMDKWWSKLGPVTKSRIYHFVKDVQGFNDAKKAIEDQVNRETKRFWKQQKAFQKQHDKGVHK